MGYRASARGRCAFLLILAFLAVLRAQVARGVALESFVSNGRSLDAGLLPRGRVEVGGVRWSVDHSDAVVLKGDEDGAVSLPDVPSGVRATHLAFLHTYQPGEALEDHRAAVGLAMRQIELPPEAPTVMTYEVEYADGEVLEAPVRWGRGIEQWYRVHAVAPMIWAREAWTKDIASDSGEKVAVYALKWPNPRPDKTIRDIRVRPNDDRYNDYGDALILGVSAIRARDQGKAYYVDPRPFASDDGPGSFDQPWATLQHAVDNMGAGDTVYLRGGYYALNRPVTVPDYPAQGEQWFTISAYPGETPVLDGYGVLHNPRVQPYDPDGPRPSPFQHDRGIIEANHFPGRLRIQGLQIQRSRRAGISVHGTRAAPQGAPRPRFLEVAFNTTYLCDTMGTITHHVDDVRIIGNRVIRPHSERMAFSVPEGDPIARTQHAQEGIDLSRNTRFEVAYNQVIGGGKEAIDIISCTDGRIHHNYLDSCLNGIYIDSWSIPIERMEVDHNFVYNAFSGIPCSTEGSNALFDFAIHHNIVVESKIGGISISEATYKAEPAPIRDHRIYNNTVHRTGYHATAIGWLSSGMRLAGFPQNADFRDVSLFNNIVTDSAQTPVSCAYENCEERDIVITHNLLYPPENRAPESILEQRQAGSFRTVLGESPVAEPPRYVAPERGDFRLQDGSPAIGAGVGYNEDGEIDRDAAPVDLGALPHGSAWIPGMDWAGHITSYYRGPVRWEPVTIPREKFTMHRNHLERPSWFQRGRYGPDLQHLPAGERCWAGITWFIEEDHHNSRPTMLALGGFATEADAEAITGIPVGRKADSLAFLQTGHVRNLEDGKEVFHYMVRYADGSSEKVPVRWNRQIGHWWGGAHNLPDAELAWVLPVKARWGGRPNERLFAFTWDNPQPNREITSIDMLRTAPRENGTAAVLAISTGHR